MNEQRKRVIRQDDMIPVTRELMRYAALVTKVDAQLERASGLPLLEQLEANRDITETVRQLYLASPKAYGPLVDELNGKRSQLNAIAFRTLRSRPRGLVAA
ncbi:MAG: hypothetical protein ABIH92_01890 [Nanoarchaeota archaeon]